MGVAVVAPAGRALMDLVDAAVAFVSGAKVITAIKTVARICRIFSSPLPLLSDGSEGSLLIAGAGEPSLNAALKNREDTTVAAKFSYHRKRGDSELKLPARPARPADEIPDEARPDWMREQLSNKNPTPAQPLWQAAEGDAINVGNSLKRKGLLDPPTTGCVAMAVHEPGMRQIANLGSSAIGQHLLSAFECGGNRGQHKLRYGSVRHRMREILSIAKCPTQSGAGAVVAARKTMRRLTVPIAIKGDIPLQVGKQLHVVCGVDGSENPPGLR